MAIASALLVAAMLAAALVAGAALPDETRLPVHWGLSGEADRFAGKWEALLLPVGTVAAVALLFAFLPALEPRKEGLERSRGLYLWGWAAVLALGPVLQLATFSAAFGWGISVPHVIAGAVGLMLAVIGNQLGKSRSMYMIGMRTPWTLSSEEVWIRTHRLAGKLMVALGLAMAAAALLGVSPEGLAMITLCGLAVAAGVPVVYSFVLWRRERQASE